MNFWVLAKIWDIISDDIIKKHTNLVIDQKEFSDWLWCYQVTDVCKLLAVMESQASHKQGKSRALLQDSQSQASQVGEGDWDRYVI